MNHQNKILEKIKKNELRILLSAFILVGLLTVIINRISTESQSEKISSKQNTTSDDIDTFIPRGYVLIPMDFVNIDSLSAMIGDTAVIDIYQVDAGTNVEKSLNKGVKVVSKVKLLRAPKNPHQFAILIQEKLGDQILSFRGPFWAVLQNRSSANTEVIESEKKQKTNTVRIEYL